MKAPILKGSGQRGSDPLERRAIQFRKLLEERGQCETTWQASDQNPCGFREATGATAHRCSRYQRHGANHKCNCGNSRKVR